MFDSQSWCWPRVLSMVSRGSLLRLPCPSCPITWQGPRPVLRRQCSARTVVPLAADSPAVTTVMMALCHGCCRRAGRCWEGCWHAGSTWSLPSMFMLMASLESYHSSKHKEGLDENWVSLWPWSIHVTSLCFYFSPAKFWSAMILWLRTQHETDGFWTPTNIGCFCPMWPLKKKALQRGEWEKSARLLGNLPKWNILLQIKINATITYVQKFLLRI